ncbi:hypothetical protein SDC9_09176 [bioreactor metagenome]|uniref:Uncharacterized protein n=1 Tax=bioreactor metagenome TaxID=1076179 RepID=A0A644T9C2_9ZZZZ|nr:hypothetical protein [Negativicutes bacterium]
MTKTMTERIVLWLTLACSVFEIHGFENNIRANKKHARRKSVEQAELTEINHRLTKIEQQLNNLLSSTHPDTDHK